MYPYLVGGSWPEDFGSLLDKVSQQTAEADADSPARLYSK